MKIRNTFIIFIVSGFWHGANWTFIVWGALNAVFFLPLLLTNKNRQNLEVVAQGRYFPSLKELFQMLVTFILTVMAWIFFRAESVHHAFEYIAGVFSSSLLQFPSVFPFMVLTLILFFVLIEWLGRENQYAIEKMGFKYPKFGRWSFYLFIAMLIFLFRGHDQEFIYFQF